MGRKFSRGFVTALLLLTVALLICPGCGGGSSLSGDTGGTDPTPTENLHNRLATHMPPLAGLAAGDEFEYSLEAKFTDALYQGCGRIVYDASVMQPIAANRGQAIPPEDIFVARLDAPAQILPGSTSPQAFVPFAFTGLPDNRPSTGIKGELIKVRFRLLTTPPAECRVSLLNDAQYLQLRSPQATRLPFDLEVEVALQ